MPEDWILLRRLVVDRHWQHYPTFRARFEDTARALARETGDQRLARLTVSPRQFDRWFYGEIKTLPRDGARQVLERLLSRPVVELFTVPAAVAPPAPVPPRSDGPTAHADPDHVADLVITAAAESREHADNLVANGVDPLAVDRLHHEVVALAAEFARQPPGAVLPRAQRVRRLAHQLLDRTPRPSQARELYLVAGAACGLLAGASFDLGYRDAAAAHADAAWTYGSLIAHDGLRAWARGMQALLATWSGRPLQAQQLAADGLRHAPSGPARVRLHGIAARAWSHLGDPARTSNAVAAGLASVGERGEDDLHDRIGGEFGFDAARHAWCVSSAFVQLGHAPAAAHHARRALALYDELPPGDRSPKAEAAARVDLANAFLLEAELDGAADALRPVLTLHVHHRVDGIHRRLGTATALLTAPRLAHAQVARDLVEGINAFSRTPPLLASGASPPPALGR